MSAWDATNYAAKDTLLRVVRHEADRFFALAGAPGAWEAPTACPLWQVRDLVGHLIDVTESYFVGFDAARGGNTVPDREARDRALYARIRWRDRRPRGHRDDGTSDRRDEGRVLRCRTARDRDQAEQMPDECSPQRKCAR